MIPLHSRFWGKVDLAAYPELDPGGLPGSLLEDFKFTRDGFAENWAKVRKEWPTHIAAAGLDTSGTGGFPVHWGDGVALLDKLAESKTGFTDYYDKCVSVWATRVQTTIHGDFNTGNVWKDKSQAGKHAVADWQGLRKGPAGSDWVTFIGTIDHDVVPTATIKDTLVKYHAALVDATGGNAAEDYPLDQMLDDISLIMPHYKCL